MKKIITALFSCFVTLFLFGGVEAQLVIDDFNSGNPTTQIGAGNSSSTTTAADILGGQRTDSVVVPTLSGAEFFGSLGFSNGNLLVSQGSQDQIVGGLQYSLGGVDLTGGGTLQNFALDFTSLDSAVPLTDVLELSVTSGGTTVSRGVTIPDQNSLGEVLVDLATFGGVDLTSVDSVELEFDFANNPGRDFQLGSFAVTSVPEPGSLSILLFTASGLLLRRRRNKC